VAIQHVAKRLKEENEHLRTENMSLKKKLTALEQDHREFVAQKRWRDDTSSSKIPCPSTKKSRTTTQIETASCSGSPHGSSPSSVASSADSIDPSFTHLQSSAQSVNPVSSGNSFSSILDLGHQGKTVTCETDVAFSSFNCGLCSDGTPCVCRAVVMQQSVGDVNMKNSSYSLNHIIGLDSQTSSILDNLPAYQPPVPIRRRSGTSATSVFHVEPLRTIELQPAPSCSGDPENCLACADDSFGKAFCAAINRSVGSMPPCPGCPCGDADSNRTVVRDHGRHISKSEVGIMADHNDRTSKQTASCTTTIPTNDAWQQLKSHPNVSFGDLALLADVVARRAKCTGPRVTLSPAPDDLDDAKGQPSILNSKSEPRPVMLGESQGQCKEREHRNVSPPKLVPQEVLIECGQRQRLRQVPAAGVREALRLLDSKFS
jgi:AP-1-like transcription factor